MTSVVCFNDLIDERIKTITEWLKVNDPKCGKEQLHLDKGSKEQIYWQYGYLIALKDVRDLLRGAGNA